MKLRLVLGVLLSLPVLAQTSWSVNNQFGDITLSGSSWTSRGSFTVTGRTELLAQPPAQWATTLNRNAGGFGIGFGYYSSTRYLRVDDDADGAPAGGAATRLEISVEGRTDITWIVVRDIAAQCLRMAVWNTADGSGFVSNSQCSWTGMIARDISGAWKVGEQSEVKHAFLKIAAGARTISETDLPKEWETADLADWRFENVLTDQSGAGRHITFASPTFAATTAYSPVATPAVSGQAVTMPVLRASAVQTLTGAASYANNSVETLTYRWQQISGPATIIWPDGRAVVAPSVVCPVFGEYVVALTVVDTDGRKTSASLTLGCVATDDRDVVIYSDSRYRTIFGDMLRLGTNPWTYQDDRHVTMADRLIARRSTYPATWNTALAGTVSISSGSTTLTGSGTDFQTDFCSGGTTPVSGIKVVIWYPTGVDGEFGRRHAGVVSCASATSMTIDFTWYDPMPTSGLGANQSGVQYSKWLNASISAWILAQNNGGIEYYNSALAQLALYLRSGLTKYRDDFLTVEAQWLTMPFIDLGQSSDTIQGSRTMAPRSLNYTGLLAYWIATGDAATMRALNRYWNLLSYYGGLERESGVQTAFLGQCVLFSTDAPTVAQCKTKLNAAVAIWLANQESDGGFITPFVAGNGVSSTTKNATVTNGSTTVTSSGGVAFPNDGAWATNRMWFWDSTAPTVGDSTFYQATYVSGTQVTLDRPYEGTTRTVGWQRENIVGDGTQPFMQGMIGEGLRYAALALDTYDAPTAALVRTAIDNIGSYLITTGTDPATYGLWYARGYVNCEPPSGDANCAPGAFTNGEVFSTASTAYALSSSAPRLAFFDQMYSALFTATGYESPYPGVVADQGEFIAGSAFFTNDKWKDYGFWAGAGQAHRWAAARAGGVTAESTRTVSLAARLADKPGATQFRVTIRSADGTTATPFTCTTSCSLTVDARMERPQFRLEYLTAGSVVLATSDWQPF